MLIRHESRDDGSLWVKVYEDDTEMGYIKFVSFKKNVLESASTYIYGDYRWRGLATKMYLYVYELGYQVRPSPIQTDEGKAMWKAFRKKRLPFIRQNLFQRIWTSSVKLIG